MKIENRFQILPEGILPAPAEMMEALTNAGYSNTRARRAVLEALHAADGQATPSDLLELGRNRHPALGLVTVYRTLDILAGLGLVRRLHLDGGCHMYALSRAGLEAEQRGGATFAHSHHVICRRCRSATEFAGCDIGAVISSVEAQTGYQVSEHWLEMFGLCPDCQGADEPETASGSGGLHEK